MEEDDLLNGFFDFSKPMRRIELQGGTSNGRIVSKHVFVDEVKKRELDETTNYAQKYVTELEKDLLDRFKESYKRRMSVDSQTSSSTMDKKVDEVYSKYNFVFNTRDPNLPVMQSKEQILNAIQDYPVVILQGATGSGKTTQVPQFILDDAFASNKKVNIAVTQPRRVAASSNAQRVAAERNWPFPGIVGFQIGLDERENCNKHTRVLYCTTGLFLEKIIRNRSLGNYTHIILDEVHERNKDMDFLLIVIKKLIRPGVKIILMSATIDAERFAEYFRMPINGRFRNAPIINIGEKPKFEIENYYLDDIEYAAQLANPNYKRNYQFDINTPMIHDDIYTWALKLVVFFERMDRKASELAGVDPANYEQGPKPTVLIFLPGIIEIKTMYSRLEEWKILNKETNVLRVIMHSTVSAKQTQLVMEPTHGNSRKIILATNIAESSITVPDVKYVIDFCLTRNLITDTRTNFTTLRLDWASQSNCEQRAGRTGRVTHGKCYRLVPLRFFQEALRKSALPELVCSPLENMILKAKTLNMGTPEAILALALDKPKLSDIENTILVLKEMGALLRTRNGIICEMDGDISFIGRVMANLPIDVKLSKLVIFGYCFSVLSECIIIASALNCSKSLFKQKANNGINAYTQLLQWSNGSGSDLFAMLHAYNVWRQMHMDRSFGESNTRNELVDLRKAENVWGDRFGLDITALYECHQYVKELKKRLERLGIMQQTGPNAVKWTVNDKSIILKVVIAGAFYPNYLSRTTPDIYLQEKTAFRDMNGLDPRNTIYFKQFEEHHIRPFYVQQIKEFFVTNNVVKEENLVDVKVAFQDGAEKAFVTFRNSQKENHKLEYGLACMPGKIMPEVYKAVKLRKLNVPCKIDIMTSEYAKEKLAKSTGLILKENGRYALSTRTNNDDMICLPKFLDQHVVGRITHVDNCGRFWLQPSIQLSNIKEFGEEINREHTDIERFDRPTEIAVGLVLAAPNLDDDGVLRYYRGKVTSIYTNQKGGEFSYKIHFLDFGNSEDLVFSDLRRFRGVSAQFIDIPPRCFECCLAEVQPSILNSPNTTWSKDANVWFSEKVDGMELTVEVYSVVQGVSSVFVMAGDENINRLLVNEGFGEYCEESYASKLDSSQRKFYQQSKNTENIRGAELDRFLEFEHTPEIALPDPRLCVSKIKIKGPISPLEIDIYSVMEAGKRKTVSVDSASVNSVLLNNDPQDQTMKYMVAATIIETGSNLLARQTTLLPNIRGFGPLMALIFCPQMEVMRDKTKNRYVSILTGLGWDDNKQHPVFEEHDMAFDLDVEITREDFDLINSIRLSMDSLLLTSDGQTLANNFSERTKQAVIRKIRNLIVELIQKPRNSVEFCQEPGIKWNKYPTEDVIEPPDDGRGNRTMFPAHNVLKLYPESIERKVRLKNNCKELHRLSNIEFTMTRYETCELCNQTMDSISEIQFHLISRIHLEREAQIGFKLDDK